MEHPQGWEQGEHHSTDPRTAENALPSASRGLRSGGPTVRWGTERKLRQRDLRSITGRRRGSRVRCMRGG